MEGIRKLRCLAEREDYEFKIENGQLLYGPPRRILDDFPTRDTEIYVRMPKEIDCCKLVEMFSQVGRVYMFRMMVNFSGINRGYAFIQFTTAIEASMALQRFNNYEIIPGQRLSVTKSKNHCRLFFSNLDQALSRREIENFIKTETVGVVSINLHKIPNQECGYAIVSYETHEEAVRAKRQLRQSRMMLGKYKVAVDYHYMSESNASSSSSSSQSRSNSNCSFLSSNTSSRDESSFSSLSNQSSPKVLNAYRSSETRVDTEDSLGSIGSLRNLSEDFSSIEITSTPNKEMNRSILILTNIRESVDTEEIIRVLSVNFKHSVEKIKRVSGQVLIYFRKASEAQSVIELFNKNNKAIQKVFSSMFAEPFVQCELFWYQTDRNSNQSSNNISKSSSTDNFLNDFSKMNANPRFLN